MSILEHHSNLLPWQMVCRQTGATLKFMECEPDGSLDLNKVEALITDKTKLVACTQVSNVIGRINPIRQIADMAHRHGAVMVVDGAQSTPHIPVDVQALDADFLAFSGHKLYGPMGIGVLYGKEALLEEMPPFLTGGEMIESVTREGAVFAERPHKFEAGTVNAAGAVGLHAAIDYVNRIGFTEMHRRELALTRRAMEGIRDIPGVHVLGSENRRSTAASSPSLWTASTPTISAKFSPATASPSGQAITARSRCWPIWAIRPPRGPVWRFTTPRRRSTAC